MTPGTSTGLLSANERQDAAGPVQVEFHGVDLRGAAESVRVWEHADGGVVVDVPSSQLRCAPRTARNLALHLLLLTDPDPARIEPAEQVAAELATVIGDAAAVVRRTW